MIHATVFAKDFQKVCDFYQIFGFVPREVEPADFAILESNGAELTIVQIPATIRRDIVITNPPKVREGTPIKLSFVVPDLEEALERAQALGGSTHGFTRWSHAGYDIQDCVDPEGNVYQLRQAQAP